jgi:hypothetical protein
MLVTFKKREAGTLQLGPFSALRFEGPELRAGAGGPTIARHENQQWHARGEAFQRLDCEGPVTMAFVDDGGKPSRQLGPYAHFSVVDGVDYRDHEVFCHLDDRTNRWYVPTEQRQWTALVVQDAP